MEGEAYLRDGKVPRERQIRILAHHLDGKAYSFYMQKIATDDPNNWDLHKFFTELFNYCFPIDYRQRMRIKLDEFYQKNNQSVSDYVFELQELFSMVGTIPPEMKVVKLWYSLKTRTQKAMWRDGLNPDSSTWEEIITKAEMIEIADNVLDPRDRNKNAYSRPDHGNKPRNSTMDSASRSLTYTNRDRERNRQSQGDDKTRQPSQSRQPSQPRQGPAGSAEKHASSRRPTPQASGSGNGKPAPRKTVQFTGLSEKEMAQLRADGKCFLCKEQGHMSRNCPNKHTIKGNGNNKPPGIPSYSMDMAFIEDIDSDPDQNETLESMPIGLIGFETGTEEPESAAKDNWRKWYPLWQYPAGSARDQLGNCYEMMAEYILTIQQPYPGDDQAKKKHPSFYPPERFEVKQVRGNPSNFRITDSLSGMRTVISKS